MWVATSDNPDGTTTVTTRQHTHGSQLRGLFSNDKYNFNESMDVIETFLVSTTLSGPGAGTQAASAHRRSAFLSRERRPF